MNNYPEMKYLAPSFLEFSALQDAIEHIRAVVPNNFNTKYTPVKVGKKLVWQDEAGDFWTCDVTPKWIQMLPSWINVEWGAWGKEQINLNDIALSITKE